MVYSMFFLRIRYHTDVVRMTEISNTPAVLTGISEPGIGRFMPKKEKIIVGIARIIVSPARTFMTLFKLFEMMEAKASIVPVKMSL